MRETYLLRHVRNLLLPSVPPLIYLPSETPLIGDEYDGVACNTLINTDVLALRKRGTLGAHPSSCKPFSREGMVAYNHCQSCSPRGWISPLMVRIRVLSTSNAATLGWWMGVRCTPWSTVSSIR